MNTHDTSETLTTRAALSSALRATLPETLTVSRQAACLAALILTALYLGSALIFLNSYLSAVPLLLLFTLCYVPVALAVSRAIRRLPTPGMRHGALILLLPLAALAFPAAAAATTDGALLPWLSALAQALVLVPFAFAVAALIAAPLAFGVRFAQARWPRTFPQDSGPQPPTPSRAAQGRRPFRDQP